MILTNKFNYPEPIVNAVRNDPYTGGGDISTTRLIAPPQTVQLKKRYDEQLTEDVSDRLYSMDGQLMHLLLERAGALTNGVIIEKRYEVQVNGWTLSGQIDLVKMDDGTLMDYKKTSVWAYIFGRDEWETQANVNRYILAKNGVEIKKLQNFLLFRDWSRTKAEAETTGDYPKTQGVTIDLPLWPMEEAERYVNERVWLHQKAAAAKDEDLPLCTKEERWEKWNRKTRVTESMRCKSYCPVAQFCHQKKRADAAHGA
jgi:hypothetical protein